MKDKTAKNLLRAWPSCTTKWGVQKKHILWMRARPIIGKVKSPQLRVPGSKHFKLQPDGLWVLLMSKEGFTDIIAMEVCSSEVNFHSKRSRYLPLGSSLMIQIPKIWLKQERRFGKGKDSPTWRLTGSFTEEPEKDLMLPVRFLRVLFFLSDDLYSRAYSNIVPAGHEYFSPLSGLKGYKGQQMQNFLQGMTKAGHFYRRG